jgi:hypothetical protein
MAVNFNETDLVSDSAFFVKKYFMKKREPGDAPKLNYRKKHVGFCYK